MEHPKPKPFAEKELRLSGQFSFEQLITISTLCIPVKKKIFTQYFDDNKYTLLNNGIALRKRSEKNKTLLELKINRSHAESLEWVSNITTITHQDFIQYNFRDLPSEETLKKMRVIPQSLPFQKILTQLNQVFQTAIVRTTWTEKYKESIFTICFDEGKIVCQNHEQRVNEIEIEVQKDEKNLLLEFFRNLWVKLPNSFYQGRSKALRGFELREKQLLTLWNFKNSKTILSISFQKLKTDLLRAITLLDYISCMFCENDGKSPVNLLRNSLSEIKTFILFSHGASNIFYKEQLRAIIRNIHRMERIISSTQKKGNICYTTDIFKLYKTHTNLLLSLYEFVETLNKFSGLNR